MEALYDHTSANVSSRKVEMVCFPCLVTFSSPLEIQTMVMENEGTCATLLSIFLELHPKTVFCYWLDAFSSEENTIKSRNLQIIVCLLIACTGPNSRIREQ